MGGSRRRGWVLVGLHVFFLGSWVGWVGRGKESRLMFPVFWLLDRMRGPRPRSWARIGLPSNCLSGLLGGIVRGVSQSTVSTIIRTNILVQHTRARKDYKIMIHRFAPSEELCLYAWVDAGSQNRPDGGSTQGIVVGIGPKGLLKGDMGSVTLLSWHSNRIDRTCRSPGAAETLAAVNGEEVGLVLGSLHPFWPGRMGGPRPRAGPLHVSFLRCWVGWVCLLPGLLNGMVGRSGLPRNL